MSALTCTSMHVHESEEVSGFHLKLVCSLSDDNIVSGSKKYREDIKSGSLWSVFEKMQG